MFHVKRFVFIIFFLPLAAFSQHSGTTKLIVKNLPSLPSRNTIIEQYLNTYPEYISLNSTQKDWFYWTNYSRINPKNFWDSVVSPILETYPEIQNSYTVSLKKDLENTPSLPLLKPNKTLLATSANLATELAAQNVPPSHTSPSGVSFEERMKANEIITCSGENISFGPPNPVMMLVLLYIDSGVPGLGHRRSLLNPSFSEMGVSSATYPDHNSVVIQDFACAQK